MFRNAMVFCAPMLIALALFGCDSGGATPTISSLVVEDPPDIDGDGLLNTEETIGWRVTIYQANGQIIDYEVTSDPRNSDTDGDGVSDAIEKSSLTDPRLADTDQDQLTDWQELFEIYSVAYSQDTDGDGLLDGIEFNFHMTSPISMDTDGDQINDFDEVILATRNPRVSDLPAPTIEVGEINMQLDVRFTETTSVQTRELESRSVSSTLTQSESRQYSNTNSNTQEAMAKFSVGTEYEVSGNVLGPGGEFKNTINFEGGWTGSWTSSHTATSTFETQQAYQESMNTDEEVTEGASVTRSVDGARLQATVTIENASGLAYRIHNLQLTAFIQDPQDPTRLTPLATLLPDNEPADGFHLGPLVPKRGPFVFSNDLVFPNLVEDLMKNPRGLVFSISNYDITDELGRNFVFSSQEVVERTAALVIDYGSFDSDGDGEGDLTEYHRVSTFSGRVPDGGDHRIVFDSDGDQVGITLRSALDAIGLTHYREEDSPTSALSDEARQESYSTIVDDAGVERIFRVRDAAVEIGVPKLWEVLTATGIDQTIGLDDFIMQTEEDIKLAFVQDVDQDRMVASLEFVHNCSDAFADTDGDGLDDRQESLIGWTLQTSRGSKQVFSRCSLVDTDGDGLSDAEEAGSPIDCGTGDFVTWITDPGARDSDDDGIDDRTEICGFMVNLRETNLDTFIRTDPTNHDTDGDTASDGIEAMLRGNPMDPNDIDQFADFDGDGLVNFRESEGWEITVHGLAGIGPEGDDVPCYSICPPSVTTTTTYTVISDPYNGDTDADGIPDGIEEIEGTDPSLADTDGDGLTDAQELYGFAMRDEGIIVLDPTDADTDDDRRMDGAEAELDDHVTTRWIVRVANEDPYRAYSDPRYPDADFDTVVDGDEYNLGSDPLNANTDGDSRDDRAEFDAGLDPLQVDFRVTVLYRTLIVNQPGELNVLDCVAAQVLGADETQCGDADFLFEFNVRLPDDSTPSGLAATPTRVTDDVRVWNNMPTCVDNTFLDPWHHENDPCVPRTDAIVTPGIQMNAGNPFELFHPDYNIPEWRRAITFSMTEDQRFTIEGWVGEYDWHQGVVERHWMHFGGLDGLPATNGNGDVPAVFDGSDVASQTIENVTFEFEHHDWNSLNDPVVFILVPHLLTSAASGEIQAMYIVD